MRALFRFCFVCILLCRLRTILDGCLHSCCLCWLCAANMFVTVSFALLALVIESAYITAHPGTASHAAPSYAAFLSCDLVALAA